jgi:spore maturation protein CgeB
MDSQTFFPAWRKTVLKGIRRLLHKQVVKEYNEQVLSLAEALEVDLLFAFKAPYLTAATLRTLRKRGIRTYNYYPDVSGFAHGDILAEALREYDCIFATKPFLERDLRSALKTDTCIFVRHGYNPRVHRPWPLTAWDRATYGADVSFIGTWSPKKERLIAAVSHSIPDIKIKVWGNQWEKAGELDSIVMGRAVEGTAYAKAIQATKVNLAILSEKRKGASSGDLTTTRTYEIPACGGFMLHERTSEVLELFEEGREIACFEGVKELVEKIRYYLKHNAEREKIACAGRKRCVPAYSYDERMKECIQWHYQLTQH